MATKNTAKAAESIESTYTVQELAANAALFNTRPEVVAAALQLQHITKTTQKNADNIVRAFLKKEVK